MDPGELDCRRHIIKKTRQGHKEMVTSKGLGGTVVILTIFSVESPGSRGCGKGHSAGEENCAGKSLKS